MEKISSDFIKDNFRYDTLLLTDPCISDYRKIKKTTKERWLSWPWCPWRPFRSEYHPTIFKNNDGSFICSPMTADTIRKQVGGVPCVRGSKT